MIRYYVTPDNKQMIQMIETFCKVFMKLDGIFFSYNYQFRYATDNFIEYLADERAEIHGHKEAVAIVDEMKETMKIYD